MRCTIFPLDGVKEIAAKAERKYFEKGFKEIFKSVIFDDGHSFPIKVKKEAYDWLDDYLK